jgi:putative RecB family exonuclease
MTVAPVDSSLVVAGAVELGLPVLGSLSPSRAGDFMTCPLLFRFRTIDRLPQAPSSAATRGTVVHAVLERLFDLPAPERTPAAATALLRPEWERLLEAEPQVGTLFADEVELSTWLTSAEELLQGYFTLEDPTRLQPAEREAYVEVVLPGGLRLRGIVDRLDVAPSGDVRVVDYKTGRAPREAFEGKALFQMKFYALVLWRTRGTIPRLLQLMYLGDREILRYSPDESDLLAVERKLVALWQAIEKATQLRDFRPRRSKLCDWCDHQALCPEFGGTPPPFPAAVPGPDELLPHQVEAALRAAAQQQAAGASSGPGPAAVPRAPIQAPPGPAGFRADSPTVDV